MTVLFWLLLIPAAFAAEQRGSCETPFEVPFRTGAELNMNLRAGDIHILGSENSAVRVTCELKVPERAKDVIIIFDDAAKAGRLRIRGGPDGDVRFRIEIPKDSQLTVRCSAGDLDVVGIRGNKDISLRAGDLTIDVGDPADYAFTHASVTAGDVNAKAFGVHKGGLFRSFKRENAEGKYRLRAKLWAGDINLK